MGQNATNPIQSISYTSKDFETVYPEILDLVKELTYKWDPSLSNESDPGVILIKLLAIFEDKCNYNIDKNILECFPLSVTQETNARQLFEQLGYYMGWYKSATTDITLKWIDTENLSEKSYIIPAFTMVTDSDSGVVYSLIGPSDGLLQGEFNVSSQNLSCNGEEISFRAIQGVAVNYEISGETLITTQNLDSNNRLYFPTTDIAENGIFIHNYGFANYNSWKKKDNLLVEELGNTYYKFGVSTDGKTCYLEFPTDAEEIFKNGIYITYMKTLGESGNVGLGVIEKFYNDLAAYQSDDETKTQVLNTSNVRIRNISSSGDGEDKERISDAYSGYKKTIGTFSTLVTLRDYTNAINNSNLVSNGFVCDRTNDIQTTYKVSALVNDLTQPQVVVESAPVLRSVVPLAGGSPVTGYSYEPTLSAFSLKLYLLRYVNDPTSQENFNKTFDMLSNDELENVKSYIEDDKLISHDYVDLIPPSADSSHFCYFKNKYPLNCRVVTQYKLTEAQAKEVVTNIKKSLFKNLNSSQLDFGEDLDIDYVINAITSADDRIKNVTLDNIEYTTYAVYYDGENFQEVIVSKESEEKVTYVYKPSGTNKVTLTIDYDTFINKVGNTNYNEVEFTYNGAWTPALKDYGITTNGDVVSGDTFTARISLNQQFRDEIYTKSCLAGVTQFYVKDEEFDYKLNQIAQEQIDKNITELRGIVDINVEGSGTTESTGYKLRTNESIQFYAPNLVDSTKYSDYVKYQCILNSDSKTITANCDYELQSNEYVIFYWKEEDSSSSQYSYYCYGKGNIIKPSFNLSKNNEDDVWCTNLSFRNISTTSNEKLVANSSYLNEMIETQNEKVSALTKSTHVLSGTKNICIRTINQLDLNTSDYRCYWITNTTEEDSNGNKRYILFDDNAEDLERILNTGEYLIYSNAALTSFAVLGSGTKLTRNSINTSKWYVEAIDADEILENGTSALTNNWYTLSSGSILNVVENQFITLNPGCVLYMKALVDNGKWKATYSDTNVTITSDSASSLKLSDFLVSYTNSDEEGSERVYINDIVLDKNVGWEAKSMLNVYMSPTVGMRLLSGQKIEYKYEVDDSELIDTIEGANLSNSIYPVCLMSSEILSNNSSDFLSTVTYDDYLNKSYPSLYRYKECITDGNASYRYTDEGSVIIDIPADSTGSGHTISFKFGLPGGVTTEDGQFQGKYILKMINGSDSSQYLDIKLDGVALHSMYDVSIVDFYNAGSYYLYLEMDEALTEHTLSVTMKGNKRATTVSLQNPYKYIKPSYVNEDNETVTMTTTQFNKFDSLLSKWDINHVFNYTNEISEDNAIARPLLAKEFNNTAHVFNLYTICQFDTGERSSIKILGKIGGN